SLIYFMSFTTRRYFYIKHRDSFLIAIENSASKLLDGYRDKYTPYHVNKYFIYRALLYSEKRLPNNKKLKNEFIESTMKIINEYRDRKSTRLNSSHVSIS